MKIKFFKIEDLREECIGRSIHRIRRDYAAQTTAAESGNKDIGQLNVTRFKMVLTATDGEDLLQLEACFYSCLTVYVDQEDTKKKIEELITAIEEHLHKDFPAEYGPTKHKFWLEKGIIEEV